MCSWTVSQDGLSLLIGYFRTPPEADKGAALIVEVHWLKTTNHRFLFHTIIEKSNVEILLVEAHMTM
jgi:hypothetical protein